MILSMVCQFKRRIALTVWYKAILPIYLGKLYSFYADHVDTNHHNSEYAELNFPGDQILIGLSLHDEPGGPLVRHHHRQER